MTPTAAPVAESKGPSTGKTRRFLGREEIIKRKDVRIEQVPVPEWDEESEEAWVYVRGLSGTDRDSWENGLLTGKGKDQSITTVDIRAKLCARTICDEQGNRIFTDADVAALGQKSAAALDRVFEVAQRLSKISDKDVEELAKNSKNAPSDVS